MLEILLLIVLFILFLCLIALPLLIIGTFIHAIEYKKTYRAKIGTSLLLLFSMPLGSMTYAFIHVKRTLWKAALASYSVITLLMMTFLISIVIITSHEIQYRLMDTMDAITADTYTQLRKEEKIQLLKDLKSLHIESGLSWRNIIVFPERTYINLFEEHAHVLLDLLDDYLLDQTFSKEEQEVWQRAFEKRYLDDFVPFAYDAYQISNMPMTFLQSKLVLKAYAEISKVHVTFDTTKAKMAKKQANYLREYFRLIDFCVTEKVKTLRWLQSGGVRGQSLVQFHNHMKIIYALVRVMKPGKDLLTSKPYLIKVLRLQDQFFDKWNDAYNKGEGFPYNLRPNSPKDQLVLDMHETINKVLTLLLKTYPKEDDNNYDAFYSHLIALDLSR